MITVDRLLEYYGVKNDAALAARCGVTRGAVSKWRSEGVSHTTQLAFQAASAGVLKADKNSYEHLVIKS